MNRHSFYILLSLVFFVAATTAQEYEATYHLISKSYTLNEDGSMDYRYRKELQLFTTASFDKYGETFIVYNPEYQTLTINEAYTVRKDGSVVKTPENAFNPSLPYSCTDCERFNLLREMVVTHTALEYDATIVLDYTIHTQQPFLPSLMERVDLYEDAPVDHYEIAVTVPKEINLYYNLNWHGKQGGALPESTEGNVRKLQWKFDYLEQKTAESYLPHNELPYLMFTTFESPSSFMMDFTMQNAFMPAPASLYNDVLKPITEKEASPMEKVIAIRDYVHDNIHTNALPIRYMAYVVASPYMVWTTNCGTPVEKNLLLESMLRTAGFDARFGLLYSHLMDNPESLLRLDMDGQIFYISAASKSQLSMDVSRTNDSFIGKNGNVSLFQPESCKINREVAVSLVKSEDKLVPDVTVRNSDIVSPLSRTLQPKGNGVIAEIVPLSGRYCQLLLHDGGFGMAPRSVNLPRQRQHPVAVTPTEESYVYEVSLPADAKWIVNPYEYSKTYPFGSITVKATVSGDKLTVSRQLMLTESEISLKDYKKFREMMTQWDAPHPFVIQY